MPNILYALGDPARLGIVGQLAATCDGVSCQHLVVEGVAKSTQSHQFKVLREAGVIRMVPQGRRVLVSLRTDDLDARFPGLLQTILEAQCAATDQRHIDLSKRGVSLQAQTESAR